MRTRMIAGLATMAAAGALVAVVPGAADASTPAIGHRCGASEAGNLRYTVKKQPTVCAYLGSGGYKWVRTAAVDPTVRTPGSACSGQYPVARTPRGKAVMCSGGRWVVGP
ncbi:hypothetical protein GTV32_05345 [Gordonia sp. SID5947]|uniref:hypothetical protein n=1 Tax=Gordonia sp. SID5947 TaxID=2690315 RepID=UPI0013704799|nr:hypothetical protein [Gordonia sp. SID5947]MYR05769.1 hypothetical protein [Gordonia sp. SID5947]